MPRAWRSEEEISLFEECEESKIPSTIHRVWQEEEQKRNRLIATMSIRNNGHHRPANKFSSSKFMDSALSRGGINLTNLRSASMWGGGTVGGSFTELSPHDGHSETENALHGRLKELLVFELHKDGGSQYLHLSVRGLYKHVLAAITSPLSHPKPHVPEIPKVSLETVDEDQHVTFEAGPHPTTPGVKKSMRGAVLHVPYREKLGGYLHPRDMRRLVTPFSASNEPELIVRRHAMLLNFDPLRAIILRDRLLVLVPEGADSLLMILEKRVRGSIDAETTFFGSTMSTGSSEHDEPVPKKKDFTSTAKDWMGKVMKKSGSIETLDADSIDRALQESLHTGINKSEKSSKKSEKSSKTSSTTPKVSLTKETSSRTTEGTESSVFDDSSDTSSRADSFDLGVEWEELKSQDWIALPFELQCVDAVLHVVGGILSDDTYQLQQLALQHIQDILIGRSGDQFDDPLLVIRQMKDSIQEMGTRLQGFVQSVGKVLDEDEIMALMNLSRLLSHPDRFIKPVSTQILEEESNEPELILEASMQTGLTLTNALHLIKGQIDTASELVEQKLDAVRNKLLFANMIISVFSLCVGSASLVGSIFGMNLTNGLEVDDNAFKQISYGTLSGALLMCTFIMAVLLYSGTIPRTRLYGSE